MVNYGRIRQAQLLVVCLLGCCYWEVASYPMIIELPEESEKCIRFNVPEDDDAHVALLALATPIDEDSNTDWTEQARKLESHYVEQMDMLTRVRSSDMTIPSKFADKAPEEIEKLTEAFLKDYGGDKTTNCQVTLMNPDTEISKRKEIEFYTPMVLNHVRDMVRENPKEAEDSPLGGFSLCFRNENDDEEVYIVMEIVLVDEEKETHDGKAKKKSFKGEHLSPLADELAGSLEAAETILHEMRYLEKREARMRITSDSINSRVRKLSYVSIILLLGVTYIQVTYLKRYFRKKKLL